MSKLKYSVLVFVSVSKSKYHEYADLLGIPDLKLAQIAVADLQSTNLQLLVEEKIKALIPQLPNVPFFVEDTSLVIDSWKGLPGGLTHAFMDTVGNQGICKMMRAYKDHERAARARTVIGYFHERSGVQTFQGEVTGHIALEPHGTMGFGWDPIFIPDESEKTFGEMGLAEKNQFSMRREAANRFMRYLAQHFEL